MISKNVFQTHKELAAWWNAISHDARFDNVLLHVRSAFMENNLTPESLRGAKEFEALLVSIGENEGLGLALPGPGISHDLDNDLRRLEPAEPMKE